MNVSLVLSFQRKNFFFEKKKQKTFMRGASLDLEGVGCCTKGQVSWSA
jgi:hypothetical protein